MKRQQFYYLADSSGINWQGIVGGQQPALTTQMNIAFDPQAEQLIYTFLSVLSGAMIVSAFISRR